MRVVAILPGFIPSTIIGVLRPLIELDRLGEIELRVRAEFFRFHLHADIDWCDVAVFCRNCEINSLDALYALKQKGKRVVYEIDDNFEEISLNTEIGVHHRSFFRLHSMKRFFELSDLTRVYSERLSERAMAHKARVQVNRCYFDTSIVDGLATRLPDGVVRIAYPTGRIDDAELENRVFSAARRVLEIYEDKVELHLWRKSLPKQLVGVRGVVLNKGERNYELFVKKFFEAGFDIGLAPGVDTPFFHSKTNNKYREFGGCGVAGVYSNFQPYASSVVHEQTGLLVDSSIDAWFSAIERLVLDRGLRANIAKHAAVDVLQNYSFSSSVDSWRECLKSLALIPFECPKWVLTRKHRSVFVFVNLYDAKVSDSRFVFLKRALDCFARADLLPVAVGSIFPANLRRLAGGTSVFMPVSQLDFDALGVLLNYPSSAIVDMTAFDGPLDRAIVDLRMNTHVPFTILITSKQAKESKLGLIGCADIFVAEIHEGEISECLSLNGYSAAYLDLCERHSCYGEGAALGRARKLKNLTILPVKLFDIFKSRIGSMVMLIKYRYMK